jgi:glycosyltransferase involved in cell wall biosynthesis
MQTACTPAESLRLLLVTETFPPEINGVARTLGRWAEGLRRRGHRVEVVRPRQPAERFRSARVLGVPIPFYPELRFGLASAWRLCGLFRRTRPHLIHIATEGPLGLASITAARRMGVPVVTSFHTNFDQYLAHYGLGLLRPLVGAYLRWFHSHAGVTLAPSEGTRKRLLELGFDRVEIWSRGVDGQAFHPRFRDSGLRRRLGLKEEDLLLLYVGRLAAEKNLPALLDAFARLRKRVAVPGRRLRLALVGGGPLAETFRDSRLPDVVLPGVQVGEDLARWYASADVFAFPSTSETFGNVILEALASGLPVVAFDSPGVNERVLHDHNGLLVPPRGDLAEALATMCRDAALRRRLSEAARRSAESYDWEPIFDRLVSRYRQHALSASPGRRG